MTAHSISLAEMIVEIKARPETSRAGMILCHNGIVRESDRSGTKRVRALNVKVNRDAIERIKSWGESRPGIAATAIQAFEGEFHVGDDLLFVVVAGDIRENVFNVMREVIEMIKSEGVHKTEIYEAAGSE